MLARVGPPIFALDFQAPVDDPAAASWLGAEDDDNNRLSIVPRDYFDVVVFFDRTTAAQGNPGLK
ncbi:MAG: hypothetical protein EXS32_09630 [Opitutus sp.]|nr:hypothetical protein [Opitutus sp.]